MKNECKHQWVVDTLESSAFGEVKVFICHCGGVKIVDFDGRIKHTRKEWSKKNTR